MRLASIRDLQTDRFSRNCCKLAFAHWNPSVMNLVSYVANRISIDTIAVETKANVKLLHLLGWPAQRPSL